MVGNDYYYSVHELPTQLNLWVIEMNQTLFRAGMDWIEETRGILWEGNIERTRVEFPLARFREISGGNVETFDPLNGVGILTIAI